MNVRKIKDSNTGGFPDYQSDIEDDLLFEINLETDTSRIVYSTKNNRTRIIGYKTGAVYLLQDEGWNLYKQTFCFDGYGDYPI